MNKKKAVDHILSLIYNSDTHLPITENEIVMLNEYYKTTFQKAENFSDFLLLNPEITRIISKMRNSSGRYEIEKQLLNKKALQPGIITECVFSQCLASVLSLPYCLDLDTTPVNMVPAKLYHFIKQATQYISSARYIYYGTSDTQFIIQYGNPDAGDANIVLFDNDITIEFKENKAKAGEYDLLCNEQGKLIIPLGTTHKTSHLQWCIDFFNAEFNVFDLLGSNQKLEDSPEMKKSILTYFTKNKVDLLITSVSNELFAIKPEDILLQANGHSIISTKGSEIRTTGRNKTELFTPNTFKELLKKEGATISENNIVTMPHLTNNAYGFIQERGKAKGSYSYYKLAYAFCIHKDNLKSTNDDMLIFSINDVLQKKPTISPHITITTTKQELSDTIYKHYIKK